VSTVKGYLSAIQAIHEGVKGIPSLLKYKPLQLFLDGLYNLRPPSRRVWPAWDLPTVLKYLSTNPFEPMASATMRDSAVKTAFLLALASGLKWYIHKTHLARGDHTQLFISSVKPFHPVAKVTISNWIAGVISDAGALENDAPASAHTTRHVSSSWAFSHGVSVAEIINTVAWKSDSTFSATYLKDLTPRPSFASTVLGASASNQ